MVDKLLSAANAHVYFSISLVFSATAFRQRPCVLLFSDQARIRPVSDPSCGQDSHAGQPFTNGLVKQHI